MWEIRYWPRIKGCLFKPFSSLCRGIANAVLLGESVFPARDVNIENWSHCRLVEDLGVCSPSDMADSPPTEAGSHLAVPSPPTHNDLTPSSSPTTSRRARHSSFSNPLPSINLELEGLERKVGLLDFASLLISPSLPLSSQVDGLVGSLESETVTKAVGEVADIVKKKNPASILVTPTACSH